MVATFLSVLWYLVWGLAALYVVMTLGIWTSTLRTLGLSAIRHCPRMLRLSLRASPIRELSVALLLPIIAVPVIASIGPDAFILRLCLSTPSY